MVTRRAFLQTTGTAGAAALAAFGFIAARAWRYRLLLGNGQPRRMRTLLAVTLSSWGASLILPGPSGDAAFVMLARTRLGAPVAVGVGAAVLSRLSLKAVNNAIDKKTVPAQRSRREQTSPVISITTKASSNERTLHGLSSGRASPTCAMRFTRRRIER